MSIFNTLQQKFHTLGYKTTIPGALSRANALNTVQERSVLYSRYLRAYQGLSVRGNLNSATITQTRKLKFNFIQPVVNLSAGWFAAKPLQWDIDNDPQATAEAYQIWDRSGSDRCLLENAICAGIYGEVVGIATRDVENNLPRIEFVDPNIATPTFDGADYSRLVNLEIAYQTFNALGQEVTRREMWGQGGVEVYLGDELLSEESVRYDHLPACWIRNSSVKGLPYGISDVEPILELVEEYDHVASKQTRIIDYYAGPKLVFKGIQKSNFVQHQVGDVYFLPTDGDAKFLEWSGSGPDVDKQLTRIRNAIAEISQVPPVAFGQSDSGRTSISGIAIQILYGPLLSKTHRKQANWGPALEYLMWRCLVNSGYAKLELPQVNVHFPSATPVDGQATVAEASAKVAAKLSSRRTVMNDIGIENPESEFKRILSEEVLLSAIETQKVVDQNANTAAQAGAKGAFAGEKPGGAPPTPPAPGTPPVAMPQMDIGAILESFDKAVQIEGDNITKAEQSTP